MRKHTFVIAYDIADNKRLRKVAKLLEREAIRFQYSLFIVYDATKDQIVELCERLNEVIDEDVDDVRIYKIAGFGVRLGAAIDLEYPLNIL